MRQYFRFKIEMSTINGWIQVIYGPMFAGKTTQLIRRVKRHQHAKKKCLVVKYFLETRHTTQDIITHDQQIWKAITTKSLQEILKTISLFDVFAIDQAHYFLDIVEIAQKIANSGKIVIIAGLDSTHQRKPFNNIANLIPVAQKVSKLSAICFNCSNKAYFTKKIKEENEQHINFLACYRASCRKCHILSQELIQQNSDKK